MDDFFFDGVLTIFYKKVNLGTLFTFKKKSCASLNSSHRDALSKYPYDCDLSDFFIKKEATPSGSIVCKNKIACSFLVNSKNFQDHGLFDGAVMGRRISEISLKEK